jgi:hypothetical protein
MPAFGKPYGRSFGGSIEGGAKGGCSSGTSGSTKGTSGSLLRIVDAILKFLFFKYRMSLFVITD